MKPKVFSVTAVLSALGAGLCCIGPVIFSFLGVSAMVSRTALRYINSLPECFLGATVVARGLAYASVIHGRGRALSTEGMVLEGSTLAAAAILAYTISVEGLPQLF
jgi:hypothetical protein